MDRNNWNLKFSSSAQVVHTIGKQVISRRGLDEYGYYVRTWKTHVQSVQNCCLPSLNMQFFDALSCLTNSNIDDSYQKMCIH